MPANKKNIFSEQTKFYSLEAIRDTLLPKLMSGEIRVKFDHEEAGI